MASATASQLPVALEDVFASENFKANTRHATASELANKYAHHIKGKTILITGASPNSLGAEFATSIAAASPAMIVIAGPSPDRSAQTATAIKAVNPDVLTPVVKVDLSSMSSVRDAAAEIKRWVDHIDVLVLNAGVMGGDYRTTVDGFEHHFGTNHIGHFLFTNLLIPKVLAANRQARIIVVASEGHHTSPIRFDDINFGNGKEYNHFLAYGQSKTANALFAVELAKRLGKKDVLAFAVHPGVIATGSGGLEGLTSSGIGRNLTADDLKLLGVTIDENGQMKMDNPGAWKSLQQGSATHVYGAFDPQIVRQSGSYLADVRVANDQAAVHARSTDDAQRLWQLSEQLIGEKFDI